MSAYFLTAAATLTCPHHFPITFKPRTALLSVNAMATRTTADLADVKIACTQNQVPPCKTLQWSNVALHVKESGNAVLLTGSAADAQCLNANGVTNGPPTITNPQTVASGV